MTSPYVTIARRGEVGPTPRVVHPWSPNEIVGVIIGSLYLVTGIVFAAVSLGTVMAVSDAPSDGVSPVRTLSCLGLGLVLLLAAAYGRAKVANSVVGGAYLLAAVLLPALSDAGAGLLTLSHPHAVVHLVTAAILLGFGRTQD